METLSMNLLRRLLAAALMLSATQSVLAAGRRPDAIDLQPRICPAMEGLPPGASCLRAMVPEDYDEPAGRRIGLDIVIVKARRDEHAVPLFVFQGGPGDRTSASAGDESAVWATFGESHDLVFLDQRGNGETPDLQCTAEIPLAGSTATDLWPAAALAACGRRLAAHADLARYTTTDAARDVDEVRAALGYAQIDIAGYSYGTRLAQEVVRRNGAAVRAALLIGPEAPALAVPAGMAQTAQQSLAAIVDRCKSDTACAKAWPDLDGDLQRLQQRLVQGNFALRGKSSKRDVAIGPGIVASYLRTRLYWAGGAATLPRSIHALADAQRDQSELAAIATWRKEFDTQAPWGMYMAVTCAEDLPFVDVDAERRAARGTFLGSYRIDQQSAACSAWPHAPQNAAVHVPVVSAVPVLLLVGEFDPATPSGSTPGIVARLSHGRTIVVPNRGHSMPEDWDACLARISTSFLETADEKHLDTACVAQLRMPPFDTRPVPSNQL